VIFAVAQLGLTGSERHCWEAMGSLGSHAGSFLSQFAIRYWSTLLRIQFFDNVLSATGLRVAAQEGIPHLDPGDFELAKIDLIVSAVQWSLSREALNGQSRVPVHTNAPSSIDGAFEF
jgi:hypothetical protein